MKEDKWNFSAQLGLKNSLGLQYNFYVFMAVEFLY